MEKARGEEMGATLLLPQHEYSPKDHFSIGQLVGTHTARSRGSMWDRNKPCYCTKEAGLSIQTSFGVIRPQASSFLKHFCLGSCTTGRSQKSQEENPALLFTMSQMTLFILMALREAASLHHFHIRCSLESVLHILFAANTKKKKIWFIHSINS